MYHFFSSSLIGQQPNLVNIWAFGINEEAALANALSASFPKAVHARYFSHFMGNIEHKLSELRIPGNVAKEFIDGIMGKPTNFQLGLVDAKTLHIWMRCWQMSRGCGMIEKSHSIHHQLFLLVSTVPAKCYCRFNGSKGVH